jgi:hypothetical protein
VTSAYWHTTQDHSMDRPCKPSVLLTTTEGEPMCSQGDQLYGRVPVGTKTHSQKEEQSGPSIEEARS